MSDLDILYPEGKTVSVGGETFTLRPLTFGRVPQASALLKPVLEALGEAFSGGPPAIAWVDVLATGGESLLVAIAWAIGKPREWLDSVSIDEGVILAQALYEVNADFFTKKVMPLLTVLRVQPDGDTSSESSSPTATGGAI